MALTIDALKGLYEKLGGTDFGDVTTIPEAIDKVTEVAEGGGDEYETVAEIEVGTMTEQGGLYMYQPDNVPFPSDLTENDKLYWDEYPLTRESADLYSYNFSSELEPTGNPAYILQIDRDAGVVVDAIIANSDAIENTTVKILKKAGGETITVDDALSETSENPVQNKVITAALEAISNDYRVDIEPVIDEQTQQPVIKANKSIADIYAAAVALKHVWAKITVPGIVPSYQRMEITQYINAANTYEVHFGCVREDDGAAQPIVVSGTNTSAGDPAGDSWNYAE